MHMSGVTPDQVRRARRHRQNMTDGENKFWQELRSFRSDHGIHFRRQVPIGPYVADFAAHSGKLVIEIDGEFHFTEEGVRRDKFRDEWFHAAGYRVIRISTGELSANLNGCTETVMHSLGLMR